MPYDIDERDVFFCLFDHMRLGEMPRLAPYKDHDEEMYRMVVSEAIKFAREKVAPTNIPADEEGVRMENGEVKMPPVFLPLYKEYCESGWNTVSISAEIGGQGLPGLVTAASSEAVVGANCSFAMTPGLSAGAMNVLTEFGTEEMKKTYLPKMITGEWSGTMCLTEPNVGTFLGDLRTTAKKQDDGSYLITGTKMFITSGDHDLTKNIIHMVLARAEGSPKDIKGLSLFLVPKFRVNPDGSLGEPNDVVCSKIEEKMGIHASATCMLNYGDKGQCKGWILGNEGDGISLMFHMMNEARIGVGMQGVALGGVAYQLAKQYAKERIQGVHVLSMKDPNAPRVPIVEHPDVRRMLMEMRAMSEGIRALVYHAARLHSLAEYTEDEAEHQRASDRLEFLTPIVKAYPTDRGFEIATMAIQVLGGVGYCREYGVEQYCRDAKISSIYEGTNGVQALDLVGRKMTMKGGRLFMTFMTELSAFIDEATGHEALGGLAADLGAARDKVANIAMQFMQQAGTDPIFPVLSATPFLEALGHVIVSKLLLEQAHIAYAKQKALMAEKGVTDEEAFAKDNDDAAFYYNKKLTARFFIKNILPRVDAIAARIQTRDESCLKAIF